MFKKKKIRLINRVMGDKTSIQFSEVRRQNKLKSLSKARPRLRFFGFQNFFGPDYISLYPFAP